MIIGIKKYSIVLPVRNGGGQVKECIQSILAQTVAEFTLHVLDNCSTDGTAEWFKSLTDPRIEYVPSDKSLTIEENWNRVVSLRKNEFMTMIGHDDLLLPDYLQKMTELIRQHPDASLYQSHFTYIDINGKPVRPCQPMPATMHADEFLARECQQTMDSMGTGYMMRSRDFDELGGMGLEYPNLIFADYALWIKLIRKSYLAIASETLFEYRLHDSVSRITNGEAYAKAFGHYADFLAALRASDATIAKTLDKYGKQFLLYFCESLSHRLLKTPIDKRQTTVSAYIERCEQYAASIIPGQSFNPWLKWRIALAAILDNRAGRFIFGFFRPQSARS